MGRNRIRLTESDLHRIIEESVKNIIAEMEWQTYRSAANKAYAKGDIVNKGRASNLYAHSNYLLGKKHDLCPHTKNGKGEGTFIFSDDGAYTPGGNSIDYGEMRHTPVTVTADDGVVYGSPGDWDEYGFKNVSPKHAAKINRAMKDMEKFDNGEYEYGNLNKWPYNRGWHKKGSVER